MSNFTTIPGFSRYGVSINGEIIELSSNRSIVPTLNGSENLIVHIKNDAWKWVSPTVARLMLIAFKPLPEENMYAYASVKYIDDNKRNLNIENLVWTMETYKPRFYPNINCKIDEHITIPGFSNYKINSLGSIVSFRGKQMSPGYISKQNYLMVRLCSDSGKSTVIGIHRLLALTFLEHPIDTSGFVINHKNGNTLDNRLENIEWSTYSNNLTHAYVTELRTESHAVLAMNIETRKIKKFYSLGECGRYFGVTAARIFEQLNNKNKWTPYKGHYLKKIMDERSWPSGMSELQKANCTYDMAA